MAVFVVAHGAWSSGWAWRKMRPLLRAAGHDCFTPSYTGLGERQHLASRAVNLSLHIDDIVNVLEFEDLRDVVVIGHSFGGLVATGVADRARARVARIVYLDAFVPEDGQSLMDLLPPHARESMRAACLAGDGWRVRPRDMPPDTPEADRAGRCLVGARTRSPRSRNRCGCQARRCRRAHISTVSASMAKIDSGRSRRERAVTAGLYAEIDASHNAHITAPQELVTLLDSTFPS